MDVSNPPDPSNPSSASDSTTPRDRLAADERSPTANTVERFKVVEMFRPFDPMSVDAESQYDAVARRINRARAALIRNERERGELERQFIENDLIVRSGPRAGLSLSARGRRQRIRRLIELGIEAKRLADVERFSVRLLDRMNEELDRWARETYGP